MIMIALMIVLTLVLTPALVDPVETLEGHVVLPYM